jgi:hypothetical protein
VLFVTGVALRCFRNLLGGLAFGIVKEGPSAGKARVFEVDGTHHDIVGLEVASLVDRSFTGSHAAFENDHGLVGPGAGCDKCFVGFRIDEDVVEHRVPGHGGIRVVIHIHAGGQIDPLAVVLREDQPAVDCVHRGSRIVGSLLCVVLGR